MFLLGLLVLAASASSTSPLPGSTTWSSLFLAATLLPIPGSLALIGLRKIRARLMMGAVDRHHPRWWLLASAAASPTALFLIAVPLGWIEFANRIAGDSYLAQVIYLGLPLLALELPRLLLSNIGWLWLEAEPRSLPPGVYRLQLPRIAELWPILRLRLGWPLMLPLPTLVIGICLDLLRSHRELHELFLSTSVGSTLGMGAALLLVAALLPFAFRLAFGVVSTLPEPVGSELRKTAAKLGFAPHQVVMLPTGERALNAMMVGPLPFGRILCLTDGLLTALGPVPLTGVVAHEVGHARMGHPALLLTLTAVVPLLLLGPAMHVLDPTQNDSMLIAMLIAMIIVAAWSMLRGLAHRFEHEADIASVRAFGAGPCTQALLEVSAAALPMRNSWWGRWSSLHPDERQRCRVMWQYENNPVFRQQFDQLTYRLRLGVGAMLLTALAIASWFWNRDWPYERVLWRLNSGDVATALQLATELPEPVEQRWQRPWRTIRDHLQVAAAMASNATDWDSAVREYSQQAWPRGIALLLEQGPAAARPWLAFAVEAAPQDLTRRLVFEYCRAADEQLPERMEQASELLRKRGYPAELASVFAR